MSHIINTIFNCPTNPTAVLFLVEDTDLMTCLQRSVRDTHLLRILEAVYRNKPPESTKALWMSTSDLCPLGIPPDLLVHHQLLQDYTSFTNDHCRSATPASILSAIEALSVTFNGEAAVRHLVIFAGLGPSVTTLQHVVPWWYARHQLKQENILVHFVTPAQYTGHLAIFYEDLISEGSNFLSFNDGDCFVFHLTDPKGDGPACITHPALRSDAVLEAGDSTPPSHTNDAIPPHEPALAHQLQKMAGVERKRQSRSRRNQHPYSKQSYPVGGKASVQSSLGLSDASPSTHTYPPSSSGVPQFYVGRWKLTQN